MAPMLLAFTMVLSSDAMRTMIENIFSHATILFADNIGSVLLFTVLLGAFLAYLCKPPVSYPGNARRQVTTRHPQWKNESTVSNGKWKFVTGENSTTFGGPLVGSAVGRQMWKYDPNAEPSSSEFNPSVNINTGDKLYRNSQTKASNLTEKPASRMALVKNDVLEATRDAISFYQQLQTKDGHWPGDYGGPMFLMPGIIILCYITQVDLEQPVKQGMIDYLTKHQQVDGGWGTHIEGASTMFGTVMSYVSLRLLRVKKTENYMMAGQQFILKHGGAIRTPSWGKFWLACCGLYDWKGCNSILPELWLLPRWFPFHPGRLWCHCRMVYLPMSYLYGLRFTPELTSLLREIRSDIYTESYDSINWSKARTMAASELDMYSAPTWLMCILNEVLNIYEKSPFMWLRRRALKFAIEYIYAEDIQTNYVCIGPVNKTLNMMSVFCHSNGEKSEEFKKHMERLTDYLWVAEDGVKMQGYNGSQMWDTSFATQAILETGLASEFKDCLSRAHSFMDNTQIRENEKDYEHWFRHVSKGGWPFSTSAHGWPISDCTAEGLKAMIRLQMDQAIVPQNKHISAERFEDAVNVILTLQNHDGGWATYENNRGYGWYEYLNPSEVFGDIMIDYSYVECSSACISALKTFSKKYPKHRSTEIARSVQSGVKFIKSIQRPDGSWYGSWGVCFTYGTWFGIEGLLAGGASPSCSEIAKACDFLLSKQREDGGWSESILSCVDKVYTEHPDGSQVVPTAWALLGLMKGKSTNHEAIRRGIQYLLNQQLSTGDWAQQRISGVFNRNCGITYTAYRNIFPIWALGVYAQEGL